MHMPDAETLAPVHNELAVVLEVVRSIKRPLHNRQRAIDAAAIGQGYSDAYLTVPEQAGSRKIKMGTAKRRYTHKED